MTQPGDIISYLEMCTNEGVNLQYYVSAYGDVTPVIFLLSGKYVKIGQANSKERFMVIQ
jgi:hypothetical protein